MLWYVNRIVPVDRLEPDTYSLQNWDTTKQKCSIIDNLLNGISGKYFVIAEVLHGKVNFLHKTNFGTSLSVKARSEVVKKISRLFGVDEAAIGVSSSGASFSVSSSPAPKTLAIVPARISRAELARIIHDLRGRRGAARESAVNEALQAADLETYQEALIIIKNVLGDEIANKNNWAEKFISGKRLITVEDIKEKAPKDVDVRRVANYGAAMVLLP